MTRSSSPARVKHTFAPPKVCSGCFWESKYIALQKQHKKLRDEMLRNRMGKRLKRNESTRDEDEDDTSVVVDLVDGFVNVE